MINTISVVSQAVMSFAMLVRYTMLIRWWKTVGGQVLAGLLACLFLITFTLTATASNEGLGTTPVVVTIGRFGFTAICTYGLIRLELRHGIGILSKERRHEKEETRKDEPEI